MGLFSDCVNIFSLLQIFSNLLMIYLGIVSLYLTCSGFIEVLESVSLYSSHQIWKVLTICLYLFFSPSFFSGILIIHILIHFILFYKPLKLCSFFQTFFFCTSVWITSIDMYTNLPIFFSAESNLL